jgi:spore coat protein H
MKRKTMLWAGLLLVVSLPCQALVNADFDAASGMWPDRDGPPGWELRLDDDDQFGIVEEVGFAHSGSRSFRFSHLQRGFGGSRMDQCVVLDDPFAIRLSVHVRVEEPHPELSARLRMDFYSDEDCDEDSLNADFEQVQSDIGLSEERTPANEWVRLDSETRLGSQLGEDVRSVRVSLRVRDRSDDGHPSDPVRTVWLDSVSLEADISRIPPDQRQALRDVYQSTGGEQWARQLGWMGAEGTECQWQGVTCNDEGDEVIGLALPRNNLIGSLPESIASLSGLQPGEGLDLCWNEILVPEEIVDFVNPRHLGGDPGHCQGINPLAFSRDASGHFYQPLGRDGEGFMLHMLGHGAGLLYWATYNDFGDPVWLVATGRASDRVMQFEHLYHTRWGDDSLEVERVGRASLVLVADENGSECRMALLRFHVQGDGLGAGDGRELNYLDGLADCVDVEDRDPMLSDLEGHWFDPDQAGRGISLMPYGADQLLLNWFTYDEWGNQVWQIGVGSRVGEEHRVVFGPLLAVSGGNFNDHIDPSMLSFVTNGVATLEKLDGQWQFQYQRLGFDLLVLDLEPAEAGPSLLASTGNRIDLTMQPSDLDELYERSIWSDERLPGQVRFNQEPIIHDLTGLRFRGSSSRRMPKKSFNIRFENSQPLLFGSDRMNLNAMYTDPSMMREALSFRLFNELGLAAPRTRHFDLWINGFFEGTYTHIQRVDEWLLTMNGLDPEGTLVRDDVRDNPDLNANSVFALDLSGLDESQRLNLLSSNFNYRGDPEWGSLLELVEWVHDTPAGPEFAAGFEARFDVDTFIDWLAIHWLVGDIDSFGDDYWLYLSPDDSEAGWVIIPWDKDLSFGSHWRGEGFDVANDWFAYEYLPETAQQPGNQLVQRFMATPSLREAAELRLLDLIENIFTPQWFEHEIERLAERLADSAEIRSGVTAFNRHPANHHSERERYADHVEAIAEFVHLRQNFLTTRLAGLSGPDDQAAATIPAGSTNAVFLVDASGAALARIRPLVASEQDIHVNLQVIGDPELRGIDRRWLMELDEELPEAELTLYYRNEISNAWGRGNWWTEGLEPVGRQGELQMMIGGANGESGLETRVNPYANLAVAVVSLGAGEHEVTLELAGD